MHKRGHEVSEERKSCALSKTLNSKTVRSEIQSLLKMSRVSDYSSSTNDDDDDNLFTYLFFCWCKRQVANFSQKEYNKINNNNNGATDITCIV
jgi:hypothetical protein